MTEFEKNDAINNFIRALSRNYIDEGTLRGEASIFFRVYKQGFRHSYSNIMNTILNVNDNNVEFSLEFLSTNIEQFKDVIIADSDYNAVSTNLYKLYDHVVLEISRINIIKRTENESKQLKQELINTKKDLLNTQNTLKTIQKEANGIKTEFVTILSIFATIIVAFAGGIGFSSSILEHINSVTVYKAAIMMLISGIVLYNGLFGLMHIVAKLVGKPISNACFVGQIRVEECLGCANANKCNLMDRIWRKYPYSYYLNYLFLGLIIAISICWILDMKVFAIYANTQFNEILSIHPLRTVMGLLLLAIVAFLTHKFITRCRVTDS